MSGTSRDQERRDWTLPPGEGIVRGMDLANLDRKDADERHFLILAEHPELIEAIENDLDEIVLEGNVMSPRLHITMHEVVANQLWDNDPPETWETAARLRELGYPRHEILHMLGSVLAEEIWNMTTSRQVFDRTRFVEALAALPGSWERARPPRRAASRRHGRPSQAQRRGRRPRRG